MNQIGRWTLRWAHGEATVQSLGGLLAPVRFDLGQGRTVSSAGRALGRQRFAMAGCFTCIARRVAMLAVWDDKSAWESTAGVSYVNPKRHLRSRLLRKPRLAMH